MSLLPVVFVFCSNLSLFLAVVVLWGKWNSPLHRSFALFLFLDGFWNFTNAFVLNPASSEQTARFFSAVGALSWTMFGSVFLLYIFHFTNRSALAKKTLVRLFLWVPPVIILLIRLTTFSSVEFKLGVYGWIEQLPEVVWFDFFVVHYVTCFGVGIYMAIVHGFRANSRDLKIQAWIVGISMFIVVAITSLFDVVFRELEFNHPPIGSTFSVIWAFSTIYAMKRFRFLSISPKNAGEQIVASMNDGVVLMNCAGEILYVNEAILQITSFSNEELERQNISILTSPDTTDMITNTAAFNNHSTHILTKNKESIPVSISRFSMNNTKNSEFGDVVLIKDMTELRKTESQLELSYKDLECRVQERTRELEEETQRRSASEKEYRTLFDFAPDAYYLCDLKGVFIAGNRAAEELTGFKVDELVGKSFLELKLLHASQLSRAALLLGQNAIGISTGPSEFKLVRKDGVSITVQIRTVPIKRNKRTVVLGIARDITELKKAETEKASLENQLRQSQKLEAVGQLASGIAHEINTPTQFVSDSVHFLKDAFEDLESLVNTYQQVIESIGDKTLLKKIKMEIEEAEETADLAYLKENVPGSLDRCFDGLSRISSIVSAMKEFAHPDQREKHSADINRALQATVAIANNEHKYVADVETELGEIPSVACHVGDLNQVFLNLIVNAAHAIGDVVGNSGQKGTIRIRTAQDGDYVQIEFEDTGSGIPEAVRSRVFDPFFTTKEIGKGSGQGLAIAHSIIVDKHNGTLSFDTEIDRGTVFVIRLPINGDADGSKQIVT